MSGRPTPRRRRYVDDRVEADEPSVPAVSGEREPFGPSSEDLDEDALSVHVRRTTPPPMSPEEYRQTLALTASPDDAVPRIDEVDEDGILLTDPPSARRSESLAKMSAFADGGGLPPRISEPAGAYGIALPGAPPLPVLSIPVPFDAPSSVERIAASTERPTHLGALAELADKSATLRVAVSRARIAELALDHRAGFLLSLVDGKASIEEVLDMCPMSEHEALGVLTDLVRRGVVVVDVGRYASRGAT